MASRANKRFRVPSFSELEQSVDVPDRTILLLILELVTVLLFEINRTTIPHKTIQNQMRFQWPWLWSRHSTNVHWNSAQYGERFSGWFWSWRDFWTRQRFFWSMESDEYDRFIWTHAPRNSIVFPNARDISPHINTSFGSTLVVELALLVGLALPHVTRPLDRNRKQMQTIYERQQVVQYYQRS